MKLVLGEVDLGLPHGGVCLLLAVEARFSFKAGGGLSLGLPSSCKGNRCWRYQSSKFFV